MLRKLAILLSPVALWTAAPGGAQPTVATPPGITRTQLLDNPTVMVARLKLDPGSREPVHTHPFSALVIQLTEGRVEMLLATEKTSTARETGYTWFIHREVSHAAANVGASPFEVVTVAIKPDRPRAPAGPATAARPGITRTSVLENDEARVTRVKFDPGARETVHTHPFDLVLVALTGGRVEVMVGSDRSVEDRPAGHVWFLPREIPHAVASAASAPMEFMSIGVK
jgi:quercetin dioxygenase-like cupin family protein